MVTSAYGVQKITVDDTSGGVALTLPTILDGSLAPAVAFVTVESNTLRFRYDGTAPTTTDGHLVTAGGHFIIKGQDDIKKLRMIRTTGASAVVQVTYEKER